MQKIYLVGSERAGRKKFCESELVAVPEEKGRDFKAMDDAAVDKQALAISRRVDWDGTIQSDKGGEEEKKSGEV